MAFKSVTGADLANFDEETQNLFRKRENDPRLSYVLSVLPRRNRHNLPVIVDCENNQYMQEMKKDRNNFKYKYWFHCAFFCKFINTFQLLNTFIY